MAKNLVLNITCDEDTAMSFEQEALGSWKWLNYFLGESGDSVPEAFCSKEELMEAVNKYVAEVKSSWADAAADWYASIDKVVAEFEAAFDALVTENDLDMGWVMLRGAEWAVEVDHCFGVIVMIDRDQDDEE